MQKVQVRLTIALLFSALAVLVFFGTSVVSGQIDFLYRNAAGFITARSAAQAVALLAVIALFVAGLMIAIPTALQPGNWLRKVLYVLPIYWLGFTLVGIISTQLLGVGMVGNFFNLQGVGQITLATAWLAVGAVLSVITVTIAAARTKLSASTARNAAMTMAVASVLSLVAAIAMVVSVAIVATSAPASFGGPGGFPGGGGQNQGQGRAGANAPGGAGAPEGVGAPQSTSEAPSGNFAPGGQGQATQEAGQNGAPNGNGQAPQGVGNGAPQNGGGFPGGAPQDGGGFPGGGGPGGGSGNAVPNYEIGGTLMVIFALIGVGGAIAALRGSRTVTTTQPSVARNLPREAGMAILSGIGVTVVLVLLMQIPPVSRTNPPVQTTINWDTTQTQDLATRACLNCHSNETTWPFYAYIAPSSWLTTLHVNNARAELNFSELDSLPEFRKSMLADQIAMQIRSGSMPPKDYLLLHPEANLTDAEKGQLITGFQASLAGS